MGASSIKMARGSERGSADPPNADTTDATLLSAAFFAFGFASDFFGGIT
jgi:hypothetical protein